MVRVAAARAGACKHPNPLPSGARFDRSCAAVAASAAKRVVITGGNTGIGYEAGLELARKGYAVTLACRSDDKAAAAAARIKCVGVAAPPTVLGDSCSAATGGGGARNPAPPAWRWPAQHARRTPQNPTPPPAATALRPATYWHRSAVPSADVDTLRLDLADLGSVRCDAPGAPEAPMLPCCAHTRRGGPPRAWHA